MPDPTSQPDTQPDTAGARDLDDTAGETSEDQDANGIHNPRRRGPASYLPILEWLPGYDRSKLGADALAAALVTVLLVPQAMAYALLAELEPVQGLYAAIVPGLIYAVFGTSRSISIGPVALVSLLTADAVGKITASRAVAPEEAALVLACEIGAILVVLGLLRLGFLTRFISNPVLTGFTSAAAVLIAASQLRNLFGLDLGRSSSLYEQITAVGLAWREINPVATALGGGAIVLLLAGGGPLRRLLERTSLPQKARLFLGRATPLLVVAAAIALVAATGWGGRDVLPTAEAVPGALPPFTLPPWDAALWQAMLPTALAIAVITYVIAISTAKVLAGRSRQGIDSTQEALALGLSNLGASLTGAYPVGASISRSTLAREVGARTGAAAALVSTFTLLVTLAAGSLFDFLPKSVLAGIIMVAVASLIDLERVREIFRYSKAEFAALAGTFLAVLTLGLGPGIAVGAAVALGTHLWRTSRPRVVVTGLLDDINDYRSTERRDVEIESERVLVMRVDANLYFANIAWCEERILTEIADRPSVRCLLLDLRSVDFVDASGFDLLNRLRENLGEAGVGLQLAELKRPVLTKLRQMGLIAKLGRDAIHLSTPDAVGVLKEEMDE